MKRGLGFTSRMRRTNFVQRRLVLGHDEHLVHARAILICDGDRLKADQSRFTLEQIFVALVGQIGWIAVCVRIITFHRLDEEAVLTVMLCLS